MIESGEEFLPRSVLRLLRNRNQQKQSAGKRKRRIHVNPLLLLVIPLLFLSGPFVHAGPVGDLFKKVGLKQF